MIVTVTANAALDVTYTVDRLAPGETHRVREVHQRAGGKGVNVARVLHSLGHDVLATGFLGGRTGAALAEELTHAGVPCSFEPIDGESRRTVAVVAAHLDEATVFNEPGPLVGPAEWERLRTRVRTLAGGASVVVVSGSLPRGSVPSAYAGLVEAVGSTGATVILDADGDSLREGLRGRPGVVKPNVAELQRAVGTAIDPADDIAVWRGATQLRCAGAAVAVVSRGPAGMLAAASDGAWAARLPAAVVGNPTGAGDGAVAAIAAALADGTPWPEALRHATALAAAVVAAPVAGDFDPAVYRRQLAEVVVEAVPAERLDR